MTERRQKLLSVTANMKEFNFFGLAAGQTCSWEVKRLNLVALITHACMWLLLIINADYKFSFARAE